MDETERNKLTLEALNNYKALPIDTQSALKSLLEETVEKAKTRGDSDLVVKAYSEFLDNINAYEKIRRQGKIDA